MTSADSRSAHIAVGAGAFAGLGLQIGVWSVLIADLATSLRLSPGTLGTALIAPTAAGIISIVAGGFLVDKVGRRPIAVLGFALTATAFLLFARVGSLPALVGVMLLAGAGGSLIDISANAIGADVERHHRTQVMNWLHTGYNVGLALGAGLTVVAFVLGWPYQSIFVAVGVLLGAFAVAMTRLPMPAPIHRAARPRPRPAGDRPGWQLIVAPAVLLLTGIIVAAYLIDGSFNGFLSLYLRSVFPAGAALAASGVLAFALAGIPGRLLGGGLVRRAGPGRTMALSGALVLAGLAVAVATENALVTLAGLLLVAFALAPVVPTTLSEVARRVPDNAGRAVGAVGAVGYVALVLGPALVGRLADHTGLRFAIGSLIVAAVAIAAGGLVVASRRPAGASPAIRTSSTPDIALSAAREEPI